MITLSISAYAEYADYSDEQISFNFSYDWIRLGITDEQEAAGYKCMFTTDTANENMFGYYQVDVYGNLPEDVKRDFSREDSEAAFSEKGIAEKFNTTESSVSVITLQNNEFYKVTIDNYLTENGIIDITGLITIENGYMHGFVFYGDRQNSDYNSFLLMPSSVEFKKAPSQNKKAINFENTPLYKTVVSIASGLCIAIIFLIYRLIKKKRDQAKSKNAVFKELNDEIKVGKLFATACSDISKINGLDENLVSVEVVPFLMIITDYSVFSVNGNQQKLLEQLHPLVESYFAAMAEIISDAVPEDEVDETLQVMSDVILEKKQLYADIIQENISVHGVWLTDKTKVYNKIENCIIAFGDILINNEFVYDYENMTLPQLTRTEKIEFTEKMKQVENFVRKYIQEIKILSKKM